MGAELSAREGWEVESFYTHNSYERRGEELEAVSVLILL